MAPWISTATLLTPPQEVNHEQLDSLAFLQNPLYIIRCKGQPELIYANSATAAAVGMTLDELSRIPKLDVPQSRLNVYEKVCDVVERTDDVARGQVIEMCDMGTPLLGLPESAALHLPHSVTYSPLLLNGQVVTLAQAAIVPPQARRALAQFDATSLHIYLFARDGACTSLNQAAARSAQRQGHNAAHLQLRDLFRSAIFGSAEEMNAAVAMALSSIFVKQEPVHRVSLQRWSKSEPGEKACDELEMWPLTDPVSGQPAMTVIKYSATRSRKASQKLQEAARSAAEMASALEEDNAALTARLAPPGRRMTALRTLDMSSPQDKVLNVISRLLEGVLPPRSELRQLRDHVLNAGDLRQPCDLLQQLQMDDDAANTDSALLRMLGQTLGEGESRSSRQRNTLAATTSLVVVGSDMRRTGSPELSTLLPVMSSGVFGPATPQSSPRDDPRTSSSLPDNLPTMIASMSRLRSASSGTLPPGGAEDSPDRGDGDPPSTPLVVPDVLPEEEMELSTWMPDAEVGGVEFGVSTPPEVSAALECVHEWSFDAPAFDAVCGGTSLSTLSLFIIDKYRLLDGWDFSLAQMRALLLELEAGYKDNQYHSHVHAADVLQSIHAILTHAGLYQSAVLDRKRLFACIMAAVVHDFRHPGVTNDFLIRSVSDIAVLYNDRSPLENFHLAQAFTTLKEHGLNAAMSLDDFADIRTWMIDMVLSTDMKQHFGIMSLWNAMLQRSPDPDAVAPASGLGPVDATLGRLAEDDITLLFKMMLKVADVGHLYSSWDVHHAWCSRLQEEYFLQGDQEAALGLDITPLMDRGMKGIMETQAGFFDIVGTPLFEALARLLPGVQPIVDGAAANYDRWRHPPTHSCER